MLSIKSNPRYLGQIREGDGSEESLINILVHYLPHLRTFRFTDR